jgi:hypothetical protein
MNFRYKYNIDTDRSGIVYYNSNLVNQLSGSTVEPIQASFNQSLNSILISDCSKYDLCINRFSISALSIPFWVVPIIPNQPDPNLTPYFIQLSYTSVTGNTSTIQSPLLYIDTINPPTPQQGNGYGYYYSYDKQDFINMFNVAIQTAMDSLNTAFVLAYPADLNPPPVGTPFIGGIPNPDLPVLKYNESFSKFQIYYSVSRWASSNPISLYVNDVLFPLLQFPAINTVLPNLYLLEVPINDNYYVPSFTGAYEITAEPYVVMYSDHNTLGLFSPLSRIVLTSSNLPTTSENVQPSTNTYSASTPSNVNQILGAKIVTDFQPDYSTTNLINRDFIQYNQSINNSRLISMQGNPQSLSRFDITVYWSDQNNNLYPVYLYNGQSFDLKCAFIPKNYSCYPEKY